MANLKAPGLTTNSPNFLDLFWCVKEAKPSQDLEAFATFAWSLGNNWNAIRHGETGKTALQIFEASRAFLNEFQTFCVLPHHPQLHGPSLWRPPPLGWYKLQLEQPLKKALTDCACIHSSNKILLIFNVHNDYQLCKFIFEDFTGPYEQ
nr:hypothetical protein CFP56_77444 [Quercus suber]